MSNENIKYTVLVTGFGPFDQYKKNPSWEAVKDLLSLWKKYEEFPNFQLVTVQIPVSYECVSTYIPQLWQQYNPIIVLHVGVSSKAECLTIERCAHSTGYKRMDVDGKCPDETYTECCVLATQINVEELCHINKDLAHEYIACFSDDAGRYLCEYIYYKSLSINQAKTLFVHVPDLCKSSSMHTANDLYKMLSYLIKTLKHS
ncbi:pyroglutamyl-peptidase 1 [Pseudomyrmex gracilis]|uniref:pyroglutamyl-peptidase 1 n=1 Tax=Pseudomyrmex gracilis TaxID=219809 RepID=UPI000995BB74|nr:pyroglutamyl-peptidase 1 [Pseudomyrmex gracilis]